jgi:hypothetical protein
MTAGFGTETLKAKRGWTEIFQALKENNFSPRILYHKSYHSKLLEE